MIKYIVFVLLVCWHFYLQFFAYFTHFFGHRTLLNESLYDFIIVGAGTAGSLMAYRLSENGLYNVLLVEAGPSTPWFVDIPVVGPLLQQSVLDWEYQTTRQKYACKAMKGQKSGWPMGKLIGGTHWFNNMLYVRGEQGDYDSWFKNYPNYSYQKDILPFFEKFEEVAKITDETYSTISENVLEAGREIGLNLTKPHATIDKKWGTRWTTSALLQKLQKRTNFVVATNSIVSKIFMDSENGPAKAIEIVNERRMTEKFRIKANKAIILCAGVIGTPKLLQLSGIGPKSFLEQLGIPLIHDLPVGDNLQDHVTTGLDLIVLDKPPKNQLNLPTLLSPWNIFRFLIWGSGPLRSTACELITSIRSTEDVRKTSDLQLMVMGTGAASDKGVFFKHALKIRNDFWSSYFRKLHDNYTISVLPVVLHPRSRGFVRIQSLDPFQKPIIEPNYLNDNYDVSILLKGIELIQKLVSTRTMRDELGARLVTNKINGCNHFEFNTTDYWTCYVRHLTLTAYHPVGTCKLGHWNDPETVVGFDFRVRYVNNLFVADGSVIPQLPSGNVNAAVAMISEKVADIILRKYSKQNIPELGKFFSDVNIDGDGDGNGNFMGDLRSSCSIKNIFFIL